MIIGYVGKAKGVFDILYERCLYTPNMRGSITEAMIAKAAASNSEPYNLSLDAPSALARCPDYLNEPSVLEKLYESKGYIAIPSVKCHPEMAGLGIEYIWGASKKYYRKYNDLIPKNLYTNVLTSLSQTVITIEMQWAFERRCHQHGRGYLYIADEIMQCKLTQGDVTYKVIEATRELMKKQQYHRCPGEADLGFINAVIKSNS